MTDGKYSILKSIDTPADLRQLDLAILPALAAELRSFIIEVVAANGGHLGASLGTVELTIALHYCFNTPEDQLIWDVGHQAYGHKILTGRRSVFHLNRKKHGISGFPRRVESKYDAFGVGHSSTSLSAGLGMALAKRHKGDSDKTIAVIGDAAVGAGMAFEGLNHSGVIRDANFLMVLNDNAMSIDPSVGALHECLLKTSEHFRAGNLKRTELYSNQVAEFFQALSINYIGPVDGHNIASLFEVFQEVKSIEHPCLVHCITKKGKGFEPAEQGNATHWHAPGRFDALTGKVLKPEMNTEGQEPPKFQQVFGDTLAELAEGNDNIVAVTPAMPTGSGLNKMMKQFPDRTFDVGIAEQHAVTFSAGLATQGMIPYCVVYSTFAQRAYDQIIHDVALQQLKVILCLDRAGLVGEDGATHQGVFDLAYLRIIPNLIIAAPAHEVDLRNLMYTAQLFDVSGPFCLRYPRGRAYGPDWKAPFNRVEIGAVDQWQKGEGIAILSLGVVAMEVEEAIKELAPQGIRPAHFRVLFLKPLNEEKLTEIAHRYPTLITIEDGVRDGGFGSAVAEWLTSNAKSNKLVRLGVPDEFIEFASQKEQRNYCGIDKSSIVEVIKSALGK